MKKMTFDRWIIFSAIMLLLILGATKLYTWLNYPEIANWNYAQLERIDKTPKEFSFAVFGDNRNSGKVFDNLIAALNRGTALFAIDIGDMVDDGEKVRFNFFLKQLRDLHVPLLTAIGNHEVNSNGRGNYYEILGNFYYSFTVGDSYFILLDDSDEKQFDSWQMDWLEEELKRSLGYRNRFVFMHIPLYDPGAGDSKPGHSLQDMALAKRLNDLFDKSHVTMLFASHIHGYYHGVWGKTPFIITGGAGADLNDSNPEHSFYHFVMASVGNDAVKYETIKIPDTPLNQVSAWLNEAWLLICVFSSNYYLEGILLIVLIWRVRRAGYLFAWVRSTRTRGTI